MREAFFYSFSVALGDAMWRMGSTDANIATIILLLGLCVAQVVCSIVCFLKGRYGMAFWPSAFFGAMRLAHPRSYYAYWFYRRNLQKYWRAIERFGLTEEYATMIAGDIELSSEFELFLKRRLTPEQRLSGLKTTEAAEFTKLMRLGEDAYLAEKKAELDPIMDAFVAKERVRHKSEEGKHTSPN